MRLVHVASGRLFGGIEQMLVTMARERRVTPDVSVAFVVAAPAPLNRLCQELDASGATVHALGDVRLSRPASIIRARSRLRRVLAAEPADAVICHAPWSYAIFAPVVRRAGMPVLLWQHDRAEGRSLVERWAARTRTVSPSLGATPSRAAVNVMAAASFRSASTLPPCGCNADAQPRHTA